MNVVVADADLCYPATSGKRLRTLQLIKRLAGRHRITYVCRCNQGAEVATGREYLRDHGIEPVLIEQPRPRKQGLLFHARLAANLLSPLPYSVTSHDSPALRQALQSCAASRTVDLWHFEWPAYIEAVEGQHGGRTVIATHNVESVIWQRYHDTECQPLKRWYIKRQLRKFERFERRVYATSDRVVTCTDEDASILRDNFGISRVDVVGNGIDRHFFENLPAVQRQPANILFLGALDYRPNIDGVNLLLDKVFPVVRAEMPETRLLVVGRNPSPALVARTRGIAGVELHADVADVRPFLAAAGVMTVPLRVGGGSRLKILEALAAGLPVVSTLVGAEGLDLRDGVEIEIVRDIEQMANTLVTAIREPDRVQAMAHQGRHTVFEHYDWDVLADKLDQVWKTCAEKQISTRLLVG